MNGKYRLKLVLVASVAIVGIGIQFQGNCPVARGDEGQKSKAQLFKGMGNHHRDVRTKSPEAQKYFDQGLIWAFAFNHDEAIRSFKAATELDPNCAMAWWGIALCNGPHINNPTMSAEQSKAAWEALQKALELAPNSPPVEQQLIHALAARYANPPPEDRKPLDQAYSEAMRTVWHGNREDTDVGVLYAESMMDLRPWDLWTKDGQMQPGTGEILSVLDEVAQIDLSHPGMNHLYIHAYEASPHPERAVPAADRLRNAVPASGHLTHMPSHIDVLTGRWALASKQNEEAIQIDAAYRKLSPRQGFYNIYMQHNHAMLAFAAMMEGRSAEAIKAANEVYSGVPADYAEKNAGFVDGTMAIKYAPLKRFGKWDEILAESQPPAYLPITTATWHESRAIAFAAKGKLDEADRERSAFKECVAKIPPDALDVINPARDVLAVAEHYLNGEIAYFRKNIDESVAELRKAVELEDKLKYMEPPEWIQPVRHTLGAVLVDAGRYEEAEKVYREDLKHWPENGWSLFGLAKCLKARGATAEAEEVERRFKTTWTGADMQIGSSCLCVKGS